MALSASESALLTETCQNMNQAANTCRDVLEMLRSLGSSGVVDIATHNNDSDAHANVDSLAKIDTSTNAFIIGKSGDVANGIYSGSPFRIFPFGTGASKANGPTAMTFITETHGLTVNPQVQWYHAQTNSSGNLVGPINGVVGLLSWSYAFDVSGDLTKNAVQFRIENSYTGQSNKTQVVLCTKITSTSDPSGKILLFNEDAIVPLNSLPIDLGRASSPFNTAYFTTAATVTSDRREKKNISSLDSKVVDFIKSLRPIEYKYSVSKSRPLRIDEEGNAVEFEHVSGTRHHWGLIAQEVQEALVAAGYDPSDCGVWCLADKEDSDSKQSLRYEELIAPLIKAVQVLAAKVEALEGK